MPPLLELDYNFKFPSRSMPALPCPVVQVSFALLERGAGGGGTRCMGLGTWFERVRWNVWSNYLESGTLLIDLTAHLPPFS